MPKIRYTLAMSNLLSQLNPVQASAAAHHLGPALVLAGAGSGKTRTLVYRIAHLIQQHQIPPQHILAVTFTNKAAAEMRERASRLIEGSEGLWMSTFHSAGIRILRAYGEHIGLQRGFVILDDDDQLDLLKEIMENVRGIDENDKPRTLRGIIDRAKSNLLTSENWMSGLDSDRMSGIPRESITEVFRRYQSRLRNLNAIDFNDLLGETVRLFQEVPETLERIQNRARFIHIDEYQDTNRAQYELCKMLASRERNLLVVGDPDQSIYAFRGANIQNILDFQLDYPDAKVYQLEHNYRSSERVLTLANRLIVHNSQRLEKVLRPVKPLGAEIQFYQARDPRDEARFTIQQLSHAHAKGTSWQEMAILYRTNAQSRVLEEALIRSGIPNRIIGGTGFYDRREIKDILAYIRLALNPKDDISLRRIIGRPRRGIGDQALERILAWSQQQQLSLLEACSQAASFLDRGTQKVQDFAELMQVFSDATEYANPLELVQLILESSGYLEMLKAEGKEGLDRIANLDEFKVAIQEWQDEHPDGLISDFLDDSALSSAMDRSKAENPDAPEDAITLMTMHNAKGLEFAVVCIVGVEEEILPSARSLQEAGGLEEERRLFYVGITRAMEQLTLSSADSRMVFGRERSALPSRFLDEVEGSYIAVNTFGNPLGSKTAAIPTPQPTLSHTPKTTPTDHKPLAFKGGEKVSHPKFGDGMVLATQGIGEKQQVIVKFASGTKTLISAIANLSRI